MRQHTIDTPYMIGEVHCYSTEINGELVLFDSGPPTEEALATLGREIDLTRLKYVFLTHCHIDHHGLAALLAERLDVTILLPRADAHKFQNYTEGLDHLARLMFELGCDQRMADYIRDKSVNLKLAEKLLKNFEVVEESDITRRLGIEYISCPGHSQSDLVYLIGDQAISGDTLLKNIFQVPILEIDLQNYDGRFRNYSSYCNSLRLLASLKGKRIHPGHRWQIEGIDETILFYVSRLLKLARKIGTGAGQQAMADTTERVFGITQNNPFFFYMKMGEIVFANDFLNAPDELKASLEAIGLYEQVREQFEKTVNPATTSVAI